MTTDTISDYSPLTLNYLQKPWLSLQSCLLFMSVGLRLSEASQALCFPSAQHHFQGNSPQHLLMFYPNGNGV